MLSCTCKTLLLQNLSSNQNVMTSVRTLPYQSGFTKNYSQHKNTYSGVPEKIITDNGLNLNNKMMKELCDSFKIKHHNSSPYGPKMKGAVEATNKNIKRIVQKMVVTYKDWHEMLPFALHGYRTSIRTSTGATPFSLVYGMEAVLSEEVEIPSMRVLKDAELDEVEL